MLARLLLAAFFLGHAAVHAGFISPRPPATAGGPPWPFRLDSSWAFNGLGIGPSGARVMGIALIAVLVGGFSLAALASLGILPAGIWAAAITTGTVASMALLILFFHPWLLIGVAIDVVLLWLVVGVRWAPDWLTS